MYEVGVLMSRRSRRRSTAGALCQRPPGEGFLCPVGLAVATIPPDRSSWIDKIFGETKAAS